MKKIKVDHRICHIYEKGTEGPLIISAYLPGREEYLGKLEAGLDQIDESFAVCCFEAGNWFDDLSPWPSKEAKGLGKDTLEWIENSLVPYLKKECVDTEEIFMTGYSLAGLFALWAFYESSLFKGAASCSGSLWYPGWKDYAEGKSREGIVYLSLGGKEKNSPDEMVATVEERTRWMEQKLKKDENIRRSTLVMHPGGHFSNTDQREVAGVKWLLENRIR